ncbi:hypothetical protein [Streptomyces sp. MA5143a]|uniref:hypothetical protein n=1 Tax=Streptomyces sp. MA5143a TaxID=2083010 RepID=UPI000D19EE83|nr:hypothetical protein [Streptomyces sp. MA5143a]SPF03763.1 hypothetical protein SMA5143A_4548 [Streptomyces sp. MA5143a]
MGMKDQFQEKTEQLKHQARQKAGRPPQESERMSPEERARQERERAQQQPGQRGRQPQGERERGRDLRDAEDRFQQDYDI